jgi:predicted ATPase/DNA-binding XRE family transcriptional regulator
MKVLLAGHRIWPGTVKGRTFGDLLRQYRTAAGFSQEYLAEQARLSVETIGALERGVRRAPYRETVNLLSSALQLDTVERRCFEEASVRGRARHTKDDPLGVPASNVVLPVQATSFVGRTDDLRRIEQLLEAGRLVTITGSGGVGKTRAAIAVAEHLPAGRYREVRFVDLSPVSDAAFLIGTMAATLGGSLDSINTIGALAALLKAREMLIILDNCEQLIDHAALIVSEVLVACPGVSFLSTSRERLAIRGEVLYRLPSLDINSSIDLFTQRMLDAGGLSLSDACNAQLGEICERLECIPLAIELTAARVPTFGLNIVQERLYDGLAARTSFRNVPARQQTVSATIAWSVDLLRDSERALLESLSIFSGGFTLAAAEAVCSGVAMPPATIPELLSSLVDKSLVNVTQNLEHARYGMLDSVRLFALSKLTVSCDLADLAKKHAMWVGDFADMVDVARLERPEQWLRINVDPELENARTALRWALEVTNETQPELAARIVGGLRTIWLTSSRKGECTQWATAALARIDADAFPVIAARLYRAIFQAAGMAEQVSLISRASKLFEVIGDYMGVALLHAHASFALGLLGRFAEAMEAVRKVDAILAEHVPERTMSYAAALQGTVFTRIHSRRYEEVASIIAEGMAIVRRFGDDDAIVWRVLHADVEWALGREQSSLDEIDAAIALIQSEPLALGRFIARTYTRRGQILLLHGDIAGGREMARKILLHNMIATSDDVTCEVLQFVALSVATSGEVEWAARMLGAVDTVCGQPLQYPNEEKGFGQTIAISAALYLWSILRERLSEEEIENLRSRGRHLTFAEARAEAERLLS